MKDGCLSETLVQSPRQSWHLRDTDIVLQCQESLGEGMDLGMETSMDDNCVEIHYIEHTTRISA